MSFFPWNDDLSVGNALLDHDHRKLIGLVNELHSATSRGAGMEVVGKVLAELAAYAREHFQREEHHMERVRYPALDAHRCEHRELLEKVDALQHRFRNGDVTVAARVSMLLRDWLSIHIARSDRLLAAMIQSEGSAR